MSRHKPDIQVADPERAPGRIKSIVISIILSALCIPAFGMMAPPVFLGDRPERYDIIIENGRIIDGTGNPWYYGDIGIVGDTIVKTGCMKESQAIRRINAEGMFVSPGFIDIHTHSDNQILKIPAADNTVRQGITTIVGGNCGGSPADIAGFMDQMTETGISVNFITLAGHNSIRVKVMGHENRAPSPDELAAMKKIVAESMESGAYGLSTGLYYTPGFYATTEEVVELAKVAAGYGGIYVTHLRDESNYNIGLLAAIVEAVSIGESADIPVQISHMKCLGKPVWHKSDEALELISSARVRGVDVMFDQYPYTASSTSLWGAIFPAWAQEGGPREFFKRIDDPEARNKIESGIEYNIERRGGAHTLFVIRENSYLSELAERWDMDPVNAAIKIQKEGGSGVISFNMTDHDLENFLKSPIGMIGSDGSISSSDYSGHPRSFGAFPRVLGLYVREKNILTWEEAVRKMTSAPANRLGLYDRGMIRPGMSADIVIFDPATVKDMATYDNPSQYPEGIPYVIVNGQVVIDNNDHTGISAGKVLKKQR